LFCVTLGLECKHWVFFSCIYVVDSRRRLCFQVIWEMGRDNRSTGRSIRYARHMDNENCACRLTNRSTEESISALFVYICGLTGQPQMLVCSLFGFQLTACSTAKELSSLEVGHGLTAQSICFSSGHIPYHWWSTARSTDKAFLP